jgi:hypothetical protein
MNNLVSPQNIYIDTSALRGMSFHKDVGGLLALSNAGKIRLCISETTLWERGRQQYEDDCKNRIIPFTNNIGLYLAWFKKYFEENGVRVIPTDDRIIDKVSSYLQNDDFYFNKDDKNDQRDAHVLATAELKLEKRDLILCPDGELAQTFEKIGFTVRRDFKNFLSEVMGKENDIPIIIPPSLDTIDKYQIPKVFTKHFERFISEADGDSFYKYKTTLPIITDKLNAILENMGVLDAEIRRRVLGYAQWFSPVGKNNLFLLLEPRHYGKAQIESNAQRLKQENLLIETENHWLTNTHNAEAKEICEQAMAVVMPEILEIMELN